MRREGIYGWKIDSNNPMKYGIVKIEGGPGGVGPANDGHKRVSIYVRVEDLQQRLIGQGAARRTRTRPLQASACGELTAWQAKHQSPGVATGLLRTRGARFAAELLMPLNETRRRWFGLSQGASREEMVRHLAEVFR